MARKFYLGDVVQMRKAHPCGNDRWEVLRTGMDFASSVSVALGWSCCRRKFEKQVKAIVSRIFDEEPDGSA